MNGRKFTTLRMETLGAGRNAVTDNVDDGGASQRVATARAMEWQKKIGKEIPDGDVLTTFPGPQETGPVRELNWNPSDGGLPDIDPVENLTEADMDAIFGAKDAEPTVMSFYAGKSFAEGRAAHNAHRVSQGQAPIPDGRK